MIKNRKVLFIFLISLLVINLLFFVSYEIVKYNNTSKKIVNFLREGNLEEAVNLINNDNNVVFIEKLSFFPIIGQGIQLRRCLKRIDDNLKEINNGFLLTLMLQQDKDSLFYLRDINKCFDYLNRYNIDYIKDQKRDLENWLLFFGDDKPKNYLVLFQDTAIPRPTGGFIGAYAILSFNKGNIEFTGNNIFALEEVFLEKIIPPNALQSFSDKWFLHDANWFFDYPSSGQKILDFYSNTGSKPLLDGVILVNFSILNDLLQIIGPIKVDNYDSIIDQSNFYSFFKDQIREGAKPAPIRKQAELFSAFFQGLQTKLREVSPQVLSQVPDVLSSGFIKKEIQLYVIDDKLEYFFDSLNWTGRIEESKHDYLGVTFNLLNQDFSEDIRSKTIELETEFVPNGQIINTLIIGVSTSSPIDRTQETYLKIYLPKGIIIKKTENAYLKNNKDISSYYKKLGHKEDNDLFLIEKTKISNKGLGIEVYEEGGKTVVSTWTKLSEKPFKLVYKLPFNWTDFLSWELRIQKQSGQNVKFSYQLITPDNIKMMPSLFPFNKFVSLERDMTIEFKKEQ